jgi:mannose-1-phosphate guanylyltransferase
MSLYVLILAGGSGERFWPLSRRARPKQLLALFSTETLLEATLRRLDGLVPRENVLILTNADQEAGVRALAASLPAENIVAEPAKRDTAAAIALGVAWVSRRDPRATMAVLPADHLINDVAGFQRTLRTAAAAAATSGDLVTIGISPTWACPGFGYIETGKAFAGEGVPPEPATFEVSSFREKPNVTLAESFLAQGNFRWNAGMFIWSIPAILSAFSRFTPALATFIEQYHGAADRESVVRTEFPNLPKISIDYAIMEKASRVLMVEAGFDWDDVGGWLAVAQYLTGDAFENRGNTPLHAIESEGNIVFSDQPTLIGLLGVRDLIVVRTGDALLVCHKQQAERIKSLVSQLPVEYQ